MPIIYRARDDIFDTRGLDIIVNYPTLDFGWDKGLPAVFKGRYPKMFEDWTGALTIGSIKLAKTLLWEEENKPSVINLPLKESFKDGQVFSTLCEGLTNLRKCIESHFNPGQKIVLPIVVTNDGIGYMFDVLGKILSSPDFFYEVSLSPFRMQGMQGERKVYYLNWDSGVDPGLKVDAILAALRQNNIHDGNTQTIICDKAVYDPLMSRPLGFNLGNPLLHTTLQVVPQDNSAWLREKGIDGILQFKGSDNPKLTVEYL